MHRTANVARPWVGAAGLTRPPWLIVGAWPVQVSWRGAFPVRVERLPQPLRNVVGHLGGLLAELPEQGADVALVDAEVCSKILRACHA